ncbi:tetratricopeptide repeat-containing sensor histidine kinase [Cytophagales bacterium LB-30]|uniref:histidine kinase n=1 Tax=Shiella aurantiaca TaxID=3058365 RepID=A0ABT8F5F5_9BACT|nr:tetratricopeptide repeat-containing sensor histidine kinase [Shiella aurantiaca]MDN4165697.1 tetratricopeptide repeat-containing sensor histidine kinase [Shiella aurantiaca]
MLNALSLAFRNVNPDSAMYYATEAFELAGVLGQLSEKGTALHYMGVVSRMKGDYAKSNVYFSEAIGSFDQANDEKGRSDVLNSIAVTYYYLGAYDASVDYALQALNIKEEIGDKKGMANTFNNLGVLFDMQGKPQEALKYHYESLFIEKALNNEAGMASSYNNIGLIHTKLGHYNRALSYFDSSMYIRNGQDDAKGIANTLVSIGEVYIKMGLFDKARSHYKRALGLHEQVFNTEGIANSFYGLGLVAYHEQDFSTALGYFFRSMEAARSISMKRIIADNLMYITLVYEALHDYENAFVYQKQYYQLNDTVFTEDAEQRMSEMQLQYEMKKMERELELKDKEIEIRDLQIFQGQLWTYSLVIWLILLSLLGLMMYLRSRFERRVQRMLKEQNTKILNQKEEIAKQRDEIKQSNHRLEEAQDVIFMQNERLKSVNADLEMMVRKRTNELEESYKELLEVNAELDTFLYKASHDIKGPLLRMKGLADLGKIESTDPKERVYFQKMDEVIHQMDGILSRLLSFNKVKHRIPEEEQIDLEAFIQKTIHEVELREQESFAHKQVEVKVKEPIQIDAFLLREILYNLFDNALQFAKERNTAVLVVEAFRQDNLLILLVKDKGLGVAESVQDRIFEIFFRGTQRSQGSGLGLYIAKVAATKLHGALKYQRHPEYTVFQLVLSME